MVSTPLAPPAEPEAAPGKISWTPIAWFGGLLILCYAPILYRLIVQWATDEDMGYGFFVPVVAGFIAWQRRHQLMAIPRETNNWGLVLVVFAALQSIAATLGAELFTARMAFVIALFGVVLYLGGKAWVKALLFPLVLLLFMVPIPQILYARLTMSLQMLASELGETLIGWMGIPVFRTGNILELPSQSLDVVDACSGIRSLMSLTFLSLIYAYFSDKRIWMRWVLLIATIPIAILANGARVAITGLMSQINTDLAKGAYHEMEGYIVFIVALGALVVLHRLITIAVNKFKKA
jgi:exosortase